MAKIFDVQDWLKNHPNRNNFDLTHKVHGSYKMGILYPIMCKPVVPTDSFKIDTAVSLRFTPMPFPTQSNMRVIFHYFYVRTKNIWKNFPNWLQGLEEHTPPYIMQGDSFYRDGTLADHLDIPTSFHSVTEDFTVPYHILIGDSLDGETSISSLEDSTFELHLNNPNHNPLNPTSAGIDFLVQPMDPVVSGSNTSFPYCPIVGSDRNPIKFDKLPKSIEFENLVYNTTISTDSYHLADNVFYWELVFVDMGYYDLYGYGRIIARAELRDTYGLLSDVVYPIEYIDSGVDLSDILDAEGNIIGENRAVYCYLVNARPWVGPTALPSLVSRLIPPFKCDSVKLTFANVGSTHQIGDGDTVNPYFSSGNQTENSIKISALPFRAYESIYNAFYRNSQGVQPFVVNGQTKYNQYVTTDGDGADTTPYTLMKRNWELDAYTSCLISPQQGNVPYVGITEVSALGRMSVETPDGETASVRLMDNGEGVEISNLHGETQEARAYALRAASSGFTIPEFREANALQRFLEMNIRKGYKYIDFIEGHFGKKPTYAEMDMPEFIGGFSQRISVNEISNTNGVSTNSLGAIAGQARAIGGSKHGINHYFDDFGFVVGIMCIVPDNAYDCVLPKHYNLLNPLDMYFPEFSQLSYMPLTHEELAPIQTINDPRGSSYRNLSKVFGYQRPNHDLVWYPDTVHGLFRDATGIGNSVICRRFASRPDLCDNFLTIKPEETDTIFNYMFGDKDVALGEIVLNISAKRPIPRLVVPQIS